jgi:CDP-glycerol glycerophosphotransferase (TagB/SpsB family)
MPALRERGVEVIVRPHPSSGHRLAARTALVDGLLEAGARTEPDKAVAMTAADVLIGDVSGLTSEFLFTRKPVLLPIWPQLDTLLDPDTRASEYPFAYAWDVAATPLLERLATLETSDPLAGARTAAARRVFRGHRTIDDAVATFDLALDAARGRAGRLSVRHAFELRRRFATSR